MQRVGIRVGSLASKFKIPTLSQMREKGGAPGNIC